MDDIIIKSHKKPFKNPRKPKSSSSNTSSTIFELDLSRVVELDSSLSETETKIPILVECLLKSSDQMIKTSGIFRKSSAVCTITGMGSILTHAKYGCLNSQKNDFLSPKKDLKSRIINVYENDDSSKCLKSRVLSILEEEKFNTPNIHAAMLKNFLQNLPEPLLIPGYKKIFKIITGRKLVCSLFKPNCVHSRQWQYGLGALGSSMTAWARVRFLTAPYFFNGIMTENLKICLMRLDPARSFSKSDLKWTVERDESGRYAESRRS